MSTTSLPANVPLLPLHGVASVHALTELDEPGTGGATDDAPACSAPIGVGANGTVRLDLSRPGEHVLIAGRRGAGTSELVRSIVLSFALGLRPDDVAFVLVDGLESATFRHLDRLPHVAGSITEFDASAARRLVRSLDAELRRRAAAGTGSSPSCSW